MLEGVLHTHFTDGFRKYILPGALTVKPGHDSPTAVSGHKEVTKHIAQGSN